MSSFVWAKFMLLTQLDILSVVGWSLVILFGIGAVASYLAHVMTPMDAAAEGVISWVPVPEDLPTGPVKPYGAIALKTGYQKYMVLGVTASLVFHLVLIMGGKVTGAILHREQPVIPARVVNYAELGAPPSLSQKEAPPTGVNLGPPPPPPPSAAIPIPVPDATAPKSTTILSQQELGDLGPMFEGSGEGSIWGGGGGGGGFAGGGGGVVVDPNSGDEPAVGTYVPVEQLPELVTIPEPEYPPTAREAEVEGVVKLMVLVGKDGHVKNVKVEKSIIGLDDAAKKAASQAVFRPALWQKKPVAVWVSIPIRFSLRAS
ncbi:MAG TPA: energy transducer TonB [Acidobacteriota bacterium]|nr:energy transducer TonB [Acidobacteriota bacterium]